MTATFKASTPDDISMTMEITMPLKQWKSVRGQIKDGRDWELAGKINEMVFQAERNFYPASTSAEESTES